MAEFDVLITRVDELDQCVEARCAFLGWMCDGMDFHPRGNGGRSPEAMAVSHTPQEPAR
jgi:hypothetical protein